MLKMTIDNEEVVSDKDITINEEMLSASSTILNNVYPIEWEEDKDYTSRFYYPQDYSKALIQRSYVTQEAEAGTTIQVNGSATLNDVDTTKNSRVLKLLGQTSQTGTPTPSSPIPVNVVSGDNEINVCGKNLLAIIPPTESDQNKGITTTYDSSTGKISFSGTTTNSYPWLSNANIGIIPSGTQLVFSINTTKTYKVYARLYSSDNTYTTLALNNATSVTGTTSKDVNRIVIMTDSASGVTLNDEIYLQIEKGSSATTYEPYQGNTYNIDLPVENLLPISSLASTTSNGITFTNNNDGTYTLNGTATAEATFYIFGGNTSIVANSRLTFSCNELTSNVRIFWYDNWATLSGASQRIGGGTPNYTTTNEISSIEKLRVNISVVSGTTLNNLTIRPMLEKGSKANSYTPYGTTPIELCKIGNYQDYIYKDSDKWYLHKEIGKVVLNGTTTPFNSKHGSIKSDTKGFYQFTLPGKLHTSSSGVTDYGKSNYFELVSGSAQNSFNNNSSGIWWEGNSNYSYAILEQTSLANANTWLTTHNTEVYYALATSTNTEITDTELLNQLNALTSQ